MSNPKPTHRFTPVTGKDAGKKSKRKPLDTRFQEFLEEKATDGSTNEEQLIQALFQFGMKGNITAFTELLNRAYGRPRMQIDTEIVNREPVTINFIAVPRKKSIVNNND